MGDLFALIEREIFRWFADTDSAMSSPFGLGFRLKVLSFSISDVAATAASIRFASDARRNSRGDCQLIAECIRVVL